MKKIFLLLLCLVSSVSFAQQDKYINLKTKLVTLDMPFVQVDTFSIQPFYFEVFNNRMKRIPRADFDIDFVNAILKFKDFEKYKNQTILIKYLVYPEFLRKTYQIINPDQINRKKSSIPIFINTTNNERKPMDGLETSGYIKRGFNAGNNQSLSMQSALNIKISGQLSDKIKIKAVLSDDNLPQAYSGISQSYKEFDRIYMQLSGEHWQALGGDLLLKSSNSYFLKYLRKSQGLDITIGVDSAKVQIAGGIVDGQFAVNRFNGIEANQGPYLLKGVHGETYIFVISNTEKVFVNGKLLKRGADADYVINYQTAELRFNPNFPISQNQRIVIEFNYSVQHYLRYLNANKYQQKGKQLDFSVFTFVENDAKNKTLLYDISKTQHQTLKNAGDNLQELWQVSAVETDYDENKILYKKQTGASGEYFEYTTENISGLYLVRFTYVGSNQGSYKVKEMISNGKIYEYVGAGQGSYEPKIRLTPAQAKQYAGFDFDYHPNNRSQMIYEGIASYFDQNLFSNIDDEDNWGMASHFLFKQAFLSKKNNSLSVLLKHDYQHKYFNPLDNYRDPEFSRNWQIDSIFGKQNLLHLGLVFEQRNNQLSTGLKKYILRDTISASQVFMQADWQFKNIKFNSDFKTINQNNNQIKGQQSAYLHQEISAEIKKIILDAKAHYESRKKLDNNLLDSLNYRYKYSELSIQKKDTARFGYMLGYRLEQNDSIRWNRFFRAHKSHTVFSKISWKNKMHKMSLFMHYRHLDYYFTKRTRDYLNIKLLWQQYLFHRVFMTNLQIETFNGNTLRDEVVFIETPPGQGTHQWIDYNHNGKKEINEFELAVYSDQANYMRVILPSKNFIATLNNRYALHLIVNPKAFSKHRFWQRFYLLSQLSTTHQVAQDKFFRPLVWQPDMPLFQNTLWQNDLFFNRTQKKYFVHFSYQNLQQTQLLAVGTQSHKLEKFSLLTRHRWRDNITWEQTFSTVYNVNFSENYFAQNYRMRNNEMREKWVFHLVQKSKISFSYRYAHKQSLSGQENLLKHQLSFKYFYRDNKQNIFQTSLHFVKNSMEGNQNSPVAFQMLEGLRVGNNLVFSTLYNQKITQYIALDFRYNMRLSEDIPAIHTGGISLKMLF